MTDIVKFFVLFYACKKQKGGKNMLTFDEYLAEMEERRAREKRQAFNAELAQSLREKTHEESVLALYACMTFSGKVLDVLPSVVSENRPQLVF